MSRNSDVWLSALESTPYLQDWPASESELEDQIFVAATIVFVEPGKSERARSALRKVLGGKRYEFLIGLLAFIRTAHYWTVTHPQLAPEEDVQAYLRLNEDLARLLLEDPAAGRCDMGARLFAELEDLRELNKRQQLETEVAHKELLLREVNHRVKIVCKSCRAFFICKPRAQVPRRRLRFGTLRRGSWRSLRFMSGFTRAAPLRRYHSTVS